jgi:hypothetical protein
MEARKIEAGCARDPEGSARHGRNHPAKHLARLVERKTGNVELTVPSCSQKLIVNALRLLWEGPGGTSIRDVPSNSPVPHVRDAGGCQSHRHA